AEFGDRRVIDTPISEAAVTGVAVGAALSGWRPVVEIMFIDFITLALDQLVNHAAKARYMSGGQLRVPLVLRTQGGAGVRSGAQHSQSLEAWLAHVPGLAVVMPATPADAAATIGGFGAEVAAMVAEEAIDRLAAPIVRVGAPFTPVPASPVLEDAYLVGRREIADAVRRVLRW